MSASHCAYSDESHWNTGRYRSIALVTASHQVADSLQTELQKNLTDSGVSELKWTKVSDAKHRFTAKKFLDSSFAFIDKELLRFDILTWDIEDSRHAIQGRDDQENLSIMYWHLLQNVLKKRWPEDLTWDICPENHPAVDWEKLQLHLDRKSTDLLLEPDNPSPDEWDITKRNYFNIVNLSPLGSEDEPLIQLADLLAGLGNYSRSQYDMYLEWRDHNNKSTPDDLSNSQQERFNVIRYLKMQCEDRKLQVSLEQNGGLRSYQPSKPVNFWFWRPQHPDDTAPIRS